MVEPKSPSLPVEGSYLGVRLARRPVPPVRIRCPECSALVTKLSRHWRRAHGYSPIQVLKGDDKSVEVVPLVTKAIVKSTQDIGTKPKTTKSTVNTSGLHTCTVCGASVKSLQRHFKNTGHSNNPTHFDEAVLRARTNPKAPPPERLKCPHCKALFPNQTQLASHVFGTHGPRLFFQLNFKPPRSQRQQGASNRNEQSARNPGNVNQGPTLDAKKHWGHSFRDHGQFGSYPSHDDMDDESSA